jgi:putative YhbY family RNA-binding protein
MIKLTPVERAALRAEAHGLNPVVMIGADGLTEAGLIKVRVFGDDREERVAIYERICAELDAAPVQHIGKLLVLYRPKKDEAKERSTKSGKGLREVTIVKPSPSGTKKPTVTKVLLKGNERVTQGGNIKRAKARQASTKKTALK